MKKKILFTANFLNNAGPSKVIIGLINNLEKDKYEIYVLTLIDSNDNEIKQLLQAEGVKLIEFKIRKNILDLLSIKKLVINKILQISPDIVHTHGVVTTDIVSSKKIKSYKITTIHNSIFEDYTYTYGKIRGQLIAWYHLFKLRRFNQIVCCSKTSYKVIKNKFHNIDYIRNGVTISTKNNQISSTLKNSLGLKDNDRIFIYAGVISKRKRVTDLIIEFNKAHASNEYLLIVGDGPLLSEAKNVADKNVIFTGYKQNVTDYLNISDVYVSFSASEGFSISVIEALQCGLLLLLSDIPSHKECFEIDEKYYIGECFNSSDFNEKYLKVSTKIPNKKIIKEFATKYLSAKSMTLAYEQYYDKS